MSDTTISFCGNMMLKSVKMHFSGNTEILGFKKPTIFLWGSEVILLFKLAL